MAEAIAVLVQAMSTGEPLAEVDGVSADHETVLTETCTISDVDITVASSSATSQENAFCTKTWRTDLALIVEDKVFHVAKNILALVSPVFEAMFDSEFKKGNKDELALPGKKYADVLEFLRCIYPNSMKPVTLENVYAVLPLADEYQVAMLKAACESCLMTYLSKHISAEQVYVMLTQIESFNLPRVTERCMDIAVDRPHTEIDNADVTLSADMKSKIKARMLQKMETKCTKMSKQISTLGALCQFLGAGAKQKHLVGQYMEGRVVGDWGSFRVSSPYNDAVDLNLDGCLFTAYVANKGFSINLCIQCTYENNIGFNYFGAIVVKNWMKSKDDIIKFSEHQFYNLRDKWQLWEQQIYKIEDETAGFIYEGTVNIDVFLFKMG